MKAPLVSEQAAAAERVDFPSERRGWAFARVGDRPSLPEANATIAVPKGGAWFRHLIAFAGPGYMVSVGYMDPGNWATDLAGGASSVYAALHHHAVEPDGDPPAGARRAARDRHRPRPRTGLPRQLFAPGQPCPLRCLRACHHRLRSRRGDRHGDRTAASLRNPADRRGPHCGARRLPAAASDEQRLRYLGAFIIAL